MISQEDATLLATLAAAARDAGADSVQLGEAQQEMHAAAAGSSAHESYVKGNFQRTLTNHSTIQSIMAKTAEAIRDA